MLLLAFALVGPAAQAYIGQAPVQILMSGPSGPVPCGTTVTISATVLGSQDGKPVQQQVVQWVVAGSASRGDQLSGATSETDANGVATIDLALGSAAGKRKVSASVTIVDATSQVTCVDQLPVTSLEQSGDAPVLSRSRTADGAVPSPSNATPSVGWISIPRLGISAPIVEGDGVDVPDAAVAHYPGTAWPGQGSNTYLYGHARTGLFHELWRVRTKDLIAVTSASGTVTDYLVTRIVPLAGADDLTWLDATDGEQLTLQTCLWYDPDSPQFIVIARPLTEGQ